MCFSTDGYIVCEEFEEILRAAWVEEQELQKQKEKEVCMDVHVLHLRVPKYVWYQQSQDILVGSRKFKGQFKG